MRGSSSAGREQLPTRRRPSARTPRQRAWRRRSSRLASLFPTRSSDVVAMHVVEAEDARAVLRERTVPEVSCRSGRRRQRESDRRAGSERAARTRPRGRRPDRPSGRRGRPRSLGAPSASREPRPVRRPGARAAGRHVPRRLAARPVPATPRPEVLSGGVVEGPGALDPGVPLLHLAVVVDDPVAGPRHGGQGRRRRLLTKRSRSASRRVRRTACASPRGACQRTAPRRGS